MVPFDYIEPLTLEEAATFLSSQDTKGKVIAGGTDILLRIKERKLEVHRLVSLARIPGLRFIDDDGKWITIGAMTTIKELEKSVLIQQSLPILFDAVERFGSVQIRNVATIGGNICNAWPSGDVIPPLLALKAEVTYLSCGEKKRVELNDFFVGPGKTILDRGDILLDIHLKRPPQFSSGAYLKFSRRKGMDLPLLGIGAQIQLDKSSSTLKDATIALGVAAPTPIRAKHAEEALKGEKVTDEVLRYAGDLACQEARPRDSFRCSAEYRKAMIRILLPKVVKSALLRIERGE